MPKHLLHAAAAVSAVALIPAATAALSAVDSQTYRELDTFMNVFERVRADYVEQVERRRC